MPWADLDDHARQRRYAQAVRGFNIGIGAREPGTFARYAVAQRQLDLATLHVRPRVLARARRGSMPPLFGSAARTEILTLLAVNGPLTVRELARLRASDSSATFRTVSALIACGLVVKRDRPGGRKYVALHRGHPCFAHLRELLAALDKGYVVARVAQARARWGLPSKRDPQQPVIDKSMFGSAIRSQILILLSVVDHADEQQIARALAARHNSVWSALTPLTKSGLIVDRRVGARRVVALSNSYVGAPEFRRLLAEIAAAVPAYQSKANMIARLTRRWK